MSNSGLDGPEKESLGSGKTAHSNTGGAAGNPSNGMSRRALLASLGVAGAALVGGGVLSVSAQNSRVPWAEGGSIAVTTATGAQTVEEALDDRLISAASIDDMTGIADSELEEGMQISVRSYYDATPGVRGGGLFAVSSDTGLAENGGTIFESSGGQFRLVRLYDGPVHAQWFGAVGDGVKRTVGDVFGTLSEAQARYPHVLSLEDALDWAAIQGALNTGQCVYLNKPSVVYMLNRELLHITANQKMFGDMPGYALAGSSEFLTAKYVPYCGLMWYGAGQRYVLTRRQPRNSSSDPQDDPLSVNINVQAEGVKHQGFSVLLETQFSNPGDYGAEWDVGLFNGCRIGYKTEDVHVVGYHRVANYYRDMTRAANLPELSTPYGVTLPRGTVLSGADGASHMRPLWAGGRWAEACLGAIPGSGQYYNEATMQMVNDNRGSFGSSDYSVYDGHLSGGGHHSNRRWSDPLSPLNNELEGLSSGAQYIDARAGISAARITKQVYYNTRFDSKEPFTCRLDRVGNIRFNDCHWEWKNRSVIPAAGGQPVDPSNTGSYGYGTVAVTSRTGTVVMTGPSTNLPSESWFWQVQQTTGFAHKQLIASDQGYTRMSSGRYFDQSSRTGTSNCDQLTAPGLYRVLSTVNGPAGSSAIHLRVYADGNNLLQEATVSGGGSSATDRTFFRKYVDGVWRPWRRMVTDLDVLEGSGSPEGAVSAPVGAMYRRLDGGPGTTLYVKESGTGNTGWAAK